MFLGGQRHIAAARAGEIDHPDVLVRVRDAMDVEEPRRNQSAHTRLTGRRTFAEQFRFLRRVANRFSEANDAVSTVRFVRGEVDDRSGKLPAEARTA